MKRWRWVTGGVVALGLAVAALIVPVRDGGTVAAVVTEVAGEEGVCGKITSAGDIEVRRTVPLIDLGVVTSVDATLTNLSLGIDATDECDDIDALDGGAVIAHPRCGPLDMWSEEEAQEMEGARFDGRAALVSLCDGGAVALVAFGDQDGQLGSSSSWSNQSHEIGRELVMNQPSWCLDTSYWLESHDSTHTDTRSLEPVVVSWCVDLVNS